MEWNAAVQIRGNRALMNGKQGAAVGLGLSGFLGAFVAPLAGNGDDLDLWRHIQILDGLLKDRKNDMGATPRFPRHNQLGGGAWNIRSSRPAGCKRHGHYCGGSNR